MTKKKQKSTKVRTTVLLSADIRDAMRVVKDVQRVLPSYQMEMAILQYLQQYAELLKEHGIKL